MNAVISERLGVPIEFLGDKLKFKKYQILDLGEKIVSAVTLTGIKL